MVLVKIGQEIIKRLGPTAYKFMQSDKLVLNKAWTGFKHKSSIVSGIRSGLLAGSVVGSVINQNNDDENDGQIQPGIKTGPPYKARGRFRRRNSRRYDKYCRPNKHRRRSSYRNFKSMRNRF